MPREMARKPRAIHPSISTSANLGECSALAQILFTFGFANADDQGRITGDPKKLKLIVVPAVQEITAKNIPDLLQELVNNDLIILYRASNEPVIQFKGWWGYQGHQRWSYPSKYPPPEGWNQDRIRTRRREPPEADPPDPPIAGQPASATGQPVAEPEQPLAEQEQTSSAKSPPVPVTSNQKPVPEPEILPPVGGTKAPLPVSAPIWELKEFFYQQLHRSGKRKDQIAVLGNFVLWYLYKPRNLSWPRRDLYSQIGGMLKQYGLDALALLECLLDTLARDRRERLDDPLVFVRALALERTGAHRARDSPGQP